jgi:hypothetical protein
MNLGRPADPRPKGTGDHSRPEKRGQPKSARRTSRKTRAAGPGADSSKPNPGRRIRTPAATLTPSGDAVCRCMNSLHRQARAA